jgi:hypothetical protein
MEKVEDIDNLGMKDEILKFVQVVHFALEL